MTEVWIVALAILWAFLFGVPAGAFAINALEMDKDSRQGRSMRELYWQCSLLSLICSGIVGSWYHDKHFDEAYDGRMEP